MARKPWESLSPSYRERLSRSGVTPAMHARGEGLRKARGHANTPEHPLEAVLRPNRYRKYALTRLDLIRRVQERKEQVFGSEIRWNGPRSRLNVADPQTTRIPTIKELEQALRATDEELYADAARHAKDNEIYFLFYH